MSARIHIGLHCLAKLAQNPPRLVAGMNASLVRGSKGDVPLDGDFSSATLWRGRPTEMLRGLPRRSLGERKFLLVLLLVLVRVFCICHADVIAYYTFDDHVQDSTANKFDGTNYNVTYSTDVPSTIGCGKSACWGDHMVSRYVSLPVIRGLGSQFTVACWLKVPSGYSNPGGCTTILANSNPSVSGFQIFLNSWNSDDKRICFYSKDDLTVTDNASTVTNALSYGGWHHVAIVRDGSNVTTYVDGSVVSMSDATVNDDFPIDQSLRIGHNFQNALPNWSGNMDDFAIWDEALDSSSISNLAAGTVSPSAYMVSPVRAVAYYTFDDTAKDSSGLDYDGTLVNVSYSTDVPSAIGSGKSAYWGDHTVSRYVSLPALCELNTEFSVTCWLKVSSGYSNPGGCTTILANSNPQCAGFQLFLNNWNSDDKRICFYSKDDQAVTDNASTVTNALPSGSWHHVAVVRDGSNVTTYVDGSVVSMADATVNDDFPSDQSLRIGHNFQNALPNWSGNIDEFAIWNGALSARLIENIAAGGDSPANHTVPYWWTSYYITEMTPFYRNQTMVDVWHKSGAVLKVIPDYLTTAGDFPYQKRDYSREGYFTDHWMLVRPLGGWKTTWTGGEAGESHSDISEFDVAYLTNSVWAYRWDKLFDRIDPYVEYGYSNELTLVLDNTGWDFTSAPAEYKYGQAVPPDSMDEWESFVTNLCSRLKTNYGEIAVGNWQFRVGTETHASVRFDGTATEHNSFYDHTVNAVRSVFSDADVGPGNFFDMDDTRVFTNGWMDFIEHCARVGSPYDYTSRSLYKTASEFLDPEDAVSTFVGECNYIDAELGYSVPREIHEYGILYNENNLATSEQGAWGAAWHCHALMGLYSSGISRIQHWGLAENINGNMLLSGQGWVYMILDYLRGGELYELNHPSDSASGTQYRAYAIDRGDYKYILVSAFNTSRTLADPKSIAIDVPRDLMSISDRSMIETVALTTNSCVYDLIRVDLETAGQLDAPWSANAAIISTVAAMGGTDAKTYVSDHWSEYQQAFEDSLTLSTCPIGFSKTLDYNRFTLEVANPSVTVLSIDKRRGGSK